MKKELPMPRYECIHDGHVFAFVDYLYCVGIALNDNEDFTQARILRHPSDFRNLTNDDLGTIIGNIAAHFAHEYPQLFQSLLGMSRPSVIA